MRNNAILYILTTSREPDVYINVIAHCIEHYAIEKAVFIGIEEDLAHKEDKEKNVEDIINIMMNRLNLIISDQYPDKKTGSGYISLNLSRNNNRRYNGVKDCKIEIKIIYYYELEKELISLTNNNNYIFDGSGFAKDYLLDIYHVLYVNNIENIHVFELKTSSRTYDQQELIHNLIHKRSYDYVNLSEGIYTKNTHIIRKGSNNTINLDILEDIARSYARSYKIIYIILSLICIFITFLLVRKFGWSQMEELTFFAYTLVPLALILILSLFYEDVSVTPNGLYEKVRASRFNKLKSKYTNSDS